MHMHPTAGGGRRRAASVAGAAVVAVAATALTALPAQADAPVTSLDVAVPAALDSSDGWQFAGGVDFGVQDGALRLSNATTSGVITQLVTPQLGAAAGEPGSGGAFNTFDASFTVASATGAFQSGLKIEVAPDNGSGSRTGGSFTLYDNPATNKLEIGAIWVPFGGSSEDVSGWRSKVLASVDPTTSHTVALHERFVENGGDFTDVSVDGAYVGTVGTFEQYALDAGDPLGTLDSLLFRASTSVPSADGHGWDTQPAVPANEGAGFLVSDLHYAVSDTHLTVGTLTPVVQPAVTSLGFFQDLTDTRAHGHNVLTTSGLHVWTDGNADSDGTQNTDKAAAYHYFDAPVPLAEIGQPSIAFADGSTGGLPGLQLGIDRDGNGTWDGYLVNEGDLYGHGNWWTNKAGFGVPAGGGYASLGSLDAYLTANPHARVLSVGYSLGSGVKGDATITSLTVAGKTYPFHAPYAASVAATVTKGAYGTAGSVDLTVAAHADNGSVVATVPTGTVTVSDGSFSASAALVAGSASVTIPANLAVGKHTLAVAYSGDAEVAPVTTEIGVGVPLATSYLLPFLAEQVAGTHGYLLVGVFPDTATGTVTVTSGATTLGSATLEDGGTLVDLAPGLSAGEHELTVSYSGSATVAASSTTVTLLVEKSPSAISASWSKAHYGTAASVKVSVSGAAGAATGTVSIVEGSKALATKTLSGGKATLALPKSLAVGKHALTVRYSGSASVLSTSMSKSLTVAKASAKASASLAASKVKPNAHAKVAVTVAAAGVAVNGKATVTATSKLGHKVTVGTTVKNGKASVKLPTLRSGSYTVTVKFAGTSKIASATSKPVKLTVAW